MVITAASAAYLNIGVQLTASSLVSLRGDVGEAPSPRLRT
jgi:hypothetical protein